MVRGSWRGLVFRLAVVVCTVPAPVGPPLLAVGEVAGFQSKSRASQRPVKGRRLQREPQFPRGTCASPSGGAVRRGAGGLWGGLRFVPLAHVVSRKRYSTAHGVSSPRA